MARPAAVVVPLSLWTPSTDSEWEFKGEHTLAELFAFVAREWYSRPDFSEKARWNVGHVRALCERARLPEQPKVGHIIGWVEWLRTMYAETTVYLYWSTLRRVFELGAKAGFSKGNPAYPLALAKPMGRPHHIDDIAETWPRLLEAAAEDRRRGFIGVQRYAGLRKGEALAVKAGDVLDGPDGPELLVRRQRKAANSWRTTPTKGRRSRNVPICPELAELLRKVIELGPAQVWVGRGGQRETESPFLFPFREYDLQALGNALREVAPRAFPRGSKMWHALRDTFAIELYENGADLGVVRDWLGHSSEVVTHTNYIGHTAVRVRRDTLRFVGATPPLERAAAGVGAPTAARSGTAGVGAPAVPRRGKAVDPTAKQETKRCDTSTQKRSASTPRAATAPIATAAGRRSQRALPGLSVGPVVRKPRR